MPITVPQTQFLAQLNPRAVDSFSSAATATEMCVLHFYSPTQNQQTCTNLQLRNSTTARLRALWFRVSTKQTSHPITFRCLHLIIHHSFIVNTSYTRYLHIQKHTYTHHTSLLLGEYGRGRLVLRPSAIIVWRSHQLIGPTRPQTNSRAEPPRRSAGKIAKTLIISVCIYQRPIMP